MHTVQRQVVRRFDTKNVLGSIEQLPDQIAQAWEESTKVIAPASYAHVKNALICGMGGSGWPGEVVKRIFERRMTIPIEVVNDYDVPGWVGRDTLVVVSSYSGTTEETLRCGQQARRRRAKILALTSGGTLGAWKGKYRWPGYVFDPRYNVSGQPRMGAGYMVTGMMGLLRAAGVLAVRDAEIRDVVRMLRRGNERYGLTRAHARNDAKLLASTLEKRIPVIIASEHTRGVAEAFRNQINENAKHFSAFYELPDVNHHLLEGFGHPAVVRALHGIFIESALYRPGNQHRYRIMKRVLDGYGIGHSTIRLRQKTRLAQAFELYGFGGYVSFYMAMLHRVDPSRIPWVDYFKKQLAKS